jgi:hypothetical protein
MIHGPYNIKLISDVLQKILEIINRTVIVSEKNIFTSGREKADL